VGKVDLAGGVDADKHDGFGDLPFSVHGLGSSADELEVPLNDFLIKLFQNDLDDSGQLTGTLLLLARTT